MATVDTTVNELVINKLTQAQYDALTEKSPTELYFVTDAQEPLQVVDAVENFPACTVEDLGKLAIYTGPTTESTQETVQLVLDGTIYNGHIFGCIEVNVTMSENESVAYYMWKDVYESLPTIGDDVTGKVLSNNGIYPEWVDMPEGDKLPDQTDNAGKFLTTDGTTASWGEALVNQAKYPSYQIAIGGTTTRGTAGNIVIGHGSSSSEAFSIAIGDNCKVSAQGGILLNARGISTPYISQYSELKEAYSFYVGLGGAADGGLYKMLGRDGTIPTDRYTTTPTAAGTYVPKLTIAEDGTATREWGTESSGGGSSSQVNELPDASLNIGKVVQYVGESTGTSTNGYFYKAEQADQLTAKITNFDSYGFSTVSVEVGDFNLFVEKFGDAYGTYILTADDSFFWSLQKPDGTRNGSAPASYGINLTIDGELQTTADAPLAAASGNLEVTIVYTAPGGFVWKDIEVQKPVDIKEQLPSLSGGVGKFLMTDGEGLYWENVITPTDYAKKGMAGVIRLSSTYGTTMMNTQYLAAEVKTPDQYEAANNQMFISKGTLDNVLESYMLVPIVIEQNENSVELTDNTIYNAGEMASLSITFPTVDLKYTSQLNFTSGATATAFTAPATIKWDGDSIVNGAFVPETNKRYVIMFYYDGVNICAIARG